MENLELPVKFIISFILGGVIGLEREINEKKTRLPDGQVALNGKPKKKVALLGVRSFSLIAGLGTLAGFFYEINSLIAIVISITFILLLSAYYILDSRHTNDIGITTELAMIYCFIIGFLLTVSQFPIQLTFALAVVLVLLMSRKEKIKDIVEDISKSEINAVISFLILAFVILPFLPNQTYSLSNFPQIEEFLRNLSWNLGSYSNLEIFNPFKLWFIVVLITGVDLTGYVLERTIGEKKGWFLTSIAGGFVSSTATTITLAKESKESRNVNTLVGAAMVANLVSFFPVIILIGTLNGILLGQVFPVLLSIIVSAAVVAIYFLKFSKDDHLGEKIQKGVETHAIFSLATALKFVGLFLAVNIVSKIALESFGERGFLVASALGALPGIDAVVINTAQLAGDKVGFELAIWALILINALNMTAKSVYSFIQGKKEFALKFLFGVLIIIFSSITAQLIF